MDNQHTKKGPRSLPGAPRQSGAEGYCDALQDLINEKDPYGCEETFHVEFAAVDMVRLPRARRLEAEYITEVVNPPLHGSGVLANLDQLDVGPLVGPGLPATMPFEGVQRLVTFQRYAIALRLSRTLHEIERVQRMRNGEQIPAPGAVDVTVHVDPSKADEPSEKVTQPEKQEEPDSGTAAGKDEAAEPQPACISEWIRRGRIELRNKANKCFNQPRIREVCRLVADG